MKHWTVIRNTKKCEKCWVKANCKIQNGAVQLLGRGFLDLSRLIKQCRSVELDISIRNVDFDNHYLKRRF